MKRRPHLVVRSLSFLALSSVSGCLLELSIVSCPVHCWESFLDVTDIPVDMEHSGYFPDQCQHPGGGSVLVPLPNPGYPAKGCFLPADSNSENHFLLKAAIEAHSNGESLTTEQEDAYNLWVDVIDSAAYKSCVSHLTCNGAPGTCDIDINVDGDQSCTQNSAIGVCSTNISGTLKSQLELPTPSKYPECSSPVIVTANSANCEGHIPDMNATGGDCLDDGGVIPGDSSDSTAGLDSTGTGERSAGPFGDLDTLIACTGNDCDIDSQLILNLMENFATFYDEGVTLEIVDDTVTCGPGARIDGLDAGEAARDLADEFSIQNNDIITSVNGVEPSSANNVVRILNDIDDLTNFDVQVDRFVSSPNGPSCTRITWSIVVQP